MDFKKVSREFAMKSVLITMVMTVAGFAVAKFAGMPRMTLPLIASTAFCVLVDLATSVVFRKVAAGHPDQLPTFFMGVSGFRFLLALAMIFVWFLVADKAMMTLFIVVFCAFYFVTMIYQAAYFSKIANRL